jgi:hypothetical protein
MGTQGLLIRFLGLVLIFSAPIAKADILLKSAAGYNSHSANGVSSSRFMFDTCLGYKFKGGGWVLGGSYQNDSQGIPGSSNPRSSFGVTGGWVSPKGEGFYLLGTYYVSSKLGGYSGSGFQGDLGYYVQIGKLPVGFQLSYKSFSYEGGSYNDSLIDPYFAVIYLF